MPLSNKLRLSPRVRYGYLTDKLTPGNFHQVQPTMQVNWYPVRHSEIEVEFGGNFTHQNQTLAGVLNISSETRYVLSAG